MIKMKQVFMVSAGLASALFLGACSMHTNPLSTLDKNQAAHYLAQASLDAKSTLHLPGDRSVDAYQLCVAQAGDASVGLTSDMCDKVYVVMLADLKRRPELKDLTISDLNDKAYFSSISAEYKNAQFDAI